MIVTPLSDRSSAVRNALLSHGWEGDVALITARGLAVATFHIAGLTADVIEAMVPVASRFGLEIITGPDWLILSGGRSRLGAFARPWTLPEPVQLLANAIGMAMPPEFPFEWQHARGALALDKPIIAGILNVTPDSFSDGGKNESVVDALRHAEMLVRDGARIVDVGGESTRPGAVPVDELVEQERVIPVVAALARAMPELLIGIDTVHASTAALAVNAGASIVNDVTAGRHDAAMFGVVATHNAGMVLSHSRGALGRLASYDNADYNNDVVSGVTSELLACTARATAAGVRADAIALDPGFGFSKKSAESFALLAGLDGLVAVGRPVMIGVSRKRFLGDATGREADDRDRATAAACAIGYERGARIFRVHDPDAVRDALLVAAAAGPAT